MRADFIETNESREDVGIYRSWPFSFGYFDMKKQKCYSKSFRFDESVYLFKSFGHLGRLNQFVYQMHFTGEFEWNI